MADIKVELETAKAEVVQLQQDKEALLTANEALSTQVENLEKENASLKNGTPAEEAPQPATIPEESFKADKVEYVFTLPQFQYNGNVVTAKAALQMPALLKELVEMGFGGIKRKGE